MRHRAPAVLRMVKSVGPILVSALSLFITFLIVQPLAVSICPEFTLLASRSVGKVAFITMVIWQILLFIMVQPTTFVHSFWQTNVAFYYQDPWIKTFFAFFIPFFILHCLTLFGYTLFGYGSFVVPTFAKPATFAIRMLSGIVATFLLAWTEELIFRGTLYPYFARFYMPLTAAVITSTIFCLSHNLTSPLTLVTTEWRLGLGLFLLGLFLNLVFILTGKLYTGMGIHAGLVFVKVLLRRIPLLVFATPQSHNWLLAADLRQAHNVHIMFTLVIMGLLVANWKRLTVPSA